MDKGRTIRVPAHMAEKIRKVSSTFSEFSAERIGWDVDKVRFVTEAMPDATSLDLSVGAEGTSQIGNFVEDERASNTPGEVVRVLEKAHLEKAIKRLPARTRYVLTRRYGFDGGEPTTIAELSEELGLSKEKVRDLQRNAEHALRAVVSGTESLQPVA